MAPDRPDRPYLQRFLIDHDVNLASDAAIGTVMPTKANHINRFFHSPRSPEDHEAAVQRIRDSTSLTKLQFVMAVVQGGIISQASGLAMLDGTLPTELAGLTDSMTEMEKFELAAKLKGAQQVDRMDPFIIASGQFLGLTDEQMDAVFGINQSV